jgi:hypothetical protein
MERSMREAPRLRLVLADTYHGGSMRPKAPSTIGSSGLALLLATAWVVSADASATDRTDGV